VDAVSAIATSEEVPPSLDGVDVAGTLLRLGLDFATLRRMLVRFADGHGQTLEALRAGVASAQAPEAARHAHVIAGSAGNLGLDALREAAKALEHAARAGRTDLAALLDQVDGCAAAALRSIDTLRDVPVAPAFAAQLMDTATARAALDRLQTALADFEMSAANEAVMELTVAGVPAAAASDLARLRDLVERYDYDEAQLVAGRIGELLGTAAPRRL
jgi:HPt (histidine-containing phosphotransfer) domain-containing protein